MKKLILFALAHALPRTFTGILKSAHGCFFTILALSSLSAHATIIDFNDDDMRADFTVLNSNNPTYSAEGGIHDQAGGAGGALCCKNNHSNIVFNKALSAKDVKTFNISMLVRASGIADDASTGAIHLGFGTATEADFTGDSKADLFGLRVEGTNTGGELKWSLRTDNADEPAANSVNGLTFTSGNIFNAVSGNWYLISASFTKSDTPDQWDFTASFTDYGESGTVAGPEVSSVTGTFTQAGTYNAAELFGTAAWRSNSGNVRFQEMDSFTLSTK